MIAVLSPAKTLNEETPVSGSSTPYFRKEALELTELLKQKTPADLKKMMSISDKLALQNHERYHRFKSAFTAKNSSAAIYTFNGDVYRGFDIDTIDQKALQFADNHIRILSGLYGILKPMDRMQAYRLEMGTTLDNPKGKNLYKYWDDSVYKRIKNELRGHQYPIILNLASQEYFKVLGQIKGTIPVIHIDFKEWRKGKLVSVSFNAKKARGMMARYICDNQIENPEKLKAFDLEGYYFDENGSTDDKWLFVREG